MKELIRKLSSRKLWVAVAGIVTGVSMALGADASDIEAVSGAVTTVVSVIAYLIAEGKVDTARIHTAVESVSDAKEVLTECGESTKQG